LFHAHARFGTRLSSRLPTGVQILDHLRAHFGDLDDPAIHLAALSSVVPLIDFWARNCDAGDLGRVSVSR